MEKYLLFSGYSHKKYVAIAREVANARSMGLLCAFERKPHTDFKKTYLKLFDHAFDISEEDDCKVLAHIGSRIAAITCTQERDMHAHINVLEMCGKITHEEAINYTDMSSKLRFKERVSKHHPELVPRVYELTADSLNTLDTSILPGVIKPTGLAGSSFVYVANDVDEVRKFLSNYEEKVRENGSAFYKRNVGLVIEEYIEGPQYSVNAYIDGHGEVTLCPIMRVIPAFELGIRDTYGAIQYITSELSQTEREELESAIEKLVRIFLVHGTSAHFDAVLSGGSWKFFEVGLRIGGHRQKIFELSHSIDHVKNDLLNRLGENIFLGKQKKVVGILQTGSQERGLLKRIAYTRSVTAPKPALVREDKLAKIGREVFPVSEGGATITRHIISGNTEEEVLKTCNDLRGSIKLEVSD